MEIKEKRVLQTLAYTVVRRPGLIVAVGLLVAAAAVYFAGRIEFVTQVKDFLPQNNPSIVSWNDVTDNFASASTLVVTVEADTREEMIASARRFAAELTERAAEQELVRNITYDTDQEFLRTWALMMQDPSDLETSLSMIEGASLLPYLRNLNDAFEEEYIDSDESSENLDSPAEERDMVGIFNSMDRFVTELQTFLTDYDETRATEVAEELVSTMIFGETYSFDPNFDRDPAYQMLSISVQPTFNENDIPKVFALMEIVRAIKAEIEGENSEVSINYTGGIGMLYDDQVAIRHDLALPSVIALTAIVLLFMFSFQQLRQIVYAVIALLIGIVTDLGIIGVTIAQLNMLTATFGAILIGLGIDFAVHFVNNYNEYRIRGNSKEDALLHTYERAGMGVILGALTTAIAFYALMFTESRVISQFGFVAGTGIITTLLSTLFVLPALLVLGSRDNIRSRLPQINYEGLGTLGAAVGRHVGVVAVVILAITALLATFIPQNTFEYNLRNFGPANGVGNLTQDRVAALFRFAPDPSFITTDSSEKALQLADRLEEEQLVSEVTALSHFVRPEDQQDENLSMLADFREHDLERLEEGYDEEAFDELLYEIQRLEWNVVEIGDLATTSLGEGNTVQQKRDTMVREVLGAEVGEAGREVFQQLIGLLESDRERFRATVSDFDMYFADAMEGTVTRLTSARRHVRATDLPQSIRLSVLEESGDRNLVTIMPTEEVLDGARLVRFSERMDEISTRITGTLRLSVELADLTFREIPAATLYVIAATFIVLWVGLRRLRDALYVIVSVLFAGVWMAGLFPLVGVRVSALNAVVFPGIIGIGVDYAIHVVHRYRVEGDIVEALHLTGKGIFLSALTTIIGFGALGFMAENRLIISLGRMFAAGVFTSLIMAFTLVPAFLAVEKRIIHKPTPASK